MMYEISREIFKQRLLEPLNFVFINISSPEEFAKVKLKKETINLSYGAYFADDLQSKAADKDSNLVLFSFNPNDKQQIESAAKDASSAGYNFVYYYQGQEEDNILDKGLN